MGGAATRARDTDDRRGRPAVEDGGIFGFRDALRGCVELREDRIDGAPVEITEFGARHREVGAEFDERKHPPLLGAQTRTRRIDVRHPADRGRRVLPAEGLGDIDETTRREPGRAVAPGPRDRALPNPRR